MPHYPGDIKTSLITVDHASWYRCDGRVINETTIVNPIHRFNANILFPTGFLPDLNNYYLTQGAIQDTNTKTDANNLIIQTDNLPTNVFIGTCTNEGGHTHSVDTGTADGSHQHFYTCNENGDHTHDLHLDFATSSNPSSVKLSVTNNATQYSHNSIPMHAAGDHIHTIEQVTEAGEPTGYSGKHTHNFSMSYTPSHQHQVQTQLNTTGIQQPLELQPNSFYINYFVSFGQ